MPVISSKDQALGKSSMRTLKVPVPELGEGAEMIVRSLSRAERARYEAQMIDKEGQPIAEAIRRADERLIVLTAVDEQGKPIFSDSDLPALSQEDAAWIGRVAEAARELSGMDPKRNRKNLEDLAGN